MRVGVAGGTGERLKVISGLPCARAFPPLVAVHARCSNMRPCENKDGLLVPGQGERCDVEIVFGVTLLALVQIWRCGKLAAMSILVAIAALRETDLEHRRATSGNMTLRALHGGMLAT